MKTLIPSAPLTAYTARAVDTDRYFLGEMQTFWLEGMNQETDFELFMRKLPTGWGYLVSAGLEDALRYLENLRFTETEIAGLAQMRYEDGNIASPLLFRPEFLDYLRTFRFTGSVYAMPEGTLLFPGEPVLRVHAPLIEAKLVETVLISVINRQTSVATKAARMVDVADGIPLSDASMRRGPGTETAIATARASYIGGFTGTSSVGAALVNSIPCYGSISHSFIQAFGSEDNEQLAFETHLRHNPWKPTLLVCTYDIERGIKRAIAASKNTGIALHALRVDSGNLYDWTVRGRQMLDEAGMEGVELVDENGNVVRGHVNLFPTGDMDEYTIEDLVKRGAPMDTTYSGTALAQVPGCGFVYKLVSHDIEDLRGRNVMKRAGAKSTNPGAHQVWRGAEGDVIALMGEIVPDATPLLECVMKLGRICKGAQPALSEIRDRARAQVQGLDQRYRDIHNPEAYSVTLTDKLWRLRAQLGDTLAQAHLDMTPEQVAAAANGATDHELATLAAA